MNIDRYFSKLSKILKQNNYFIVEMMRELYVEQKYNCIILTSKELLDYTQAYRDASDIAHIQDYHYFLIISQLYQ